MTTQIDYLVGDWEEFDKTIQYFLIKNWNPVTTIGNESFNSPDITFTSNSLYYRKIGCPITDPKNNFLIGFRISVTTIGSGDKIRILIYSDISNTAGILIGKTESVDITETGDVFLYLETPISIKSVDGVFTYWLAFQVLNGSAKFQGVDNEDVSRTNLTGYDDYISGSTNLGDQAFNADTVFPGIDAICNSAPDIISATDQQLPKAWPNVKNVEAVYINLGNESEYEHTNGFGAFRFERILRIDIFGPTDAETGVIARKINDILAENYPNNARRINKSNGEVSAIGGVDRVSINFVKPPLLESIEKDRHSQLSGSLGIFWNKTVS